MSFPDFVSLNRATCCLLTQRSRRGLVRLCVFGSSMQGGLAERRSPPLHYPLVLNRSIVEQLVGPDTERSRKPMQIIDRDIVARTFQFADLRLSQAHAIGELFLTQT